MGKILEKHVYKPGDRFFDSYLDFLILNAALAYATNNIRFPGAPIERGDSAILQCNRAPFWIRVPIHGPLETALDASPVRGAMLCFQEAPEDDSEGVESTGLKTTLGNVIASVFTNFYEAHEPVLLSHVNTDKSQWPELLIFARMIRNSLSHGWRVTINSERAASGRWRGLEYGHAQNGRRTIHGDLGIGDVILLMKEACEEMDRLGLPLPT